MRLYGFLAALVVLLGSAAGLLSRSGASDAAAPPYRVSARAYDQLQTGVTSAAQLRALGFDLTQGVRLSYLAMVEQFMPDNSSGFDALDPAVQDCLQTRDRCAGYTFSLAGQANLRAVLVIQSGRLAYKSLTGEVRTSAAARMRASASD
jgi:hypothetical protein